MKGRIAIRPYNFMREIINLALKEDIGPGDITTNAVIPKDAVVEAKIIAKESGIIAGIEVAGEIFATVGAYCNTPNCNTPQQKIRFIPKIRDGRRAKKGQTIAVVKGNARAILSAERTALNFLQRLSGIATLTQRFVSRVKGTGVKILDTRKTSPGLRKEEKAAVRAGGGTNHRFGLFDSVLIKDNHIAVAKDFNKMIAAAKRKGRTEIEAGTLSQVKKALEAGADIILLDNMRVKELKKAVALIRAADKAVKIEASGGINLKNIRAVAKTGVDFISIGALTHSPKALDISLKIS